MSGDQLDLDAIEARATYAMRRGPEWDPDEPLYAARAFVRNDVPALIAEVKALRHQLDVANHHAGFLSECIDLADERLGKQTP